ncbi:9393_t:CDS:2 [Entrophospora sp. SA101]|nr:9393_t:CDS:2 [Entrophospora sp. SA101]
MYIIESEKTKMDSKSSKVVSNKKKLELIVEKFQLLNEKKAKTHYNYQLMPGIVIMITFTSKNDHWTDARHEHTLLVLLPQPPADAMRLSPLYTSMGQLPADARHSSHGLRAPFHCSRRSCYLVDEATSIAKSSEST